MSSVFSTQAPNKPAHTVPQPCFGLGAMRAVMVQLPLVQRMLVPVVAQLEGKHAYAIGKFAEDTAMSWGPRMAVSRSNIERAEVTGTEFGESLLAYFGIALAGQYLFKKLFLPLVSKAFRFDEKLLTTAVHEIPTRMLPKVLPVKAAIIASSVGLCCIMGEYALSFYKNLFTEKQFHKSHYSDVIRLSNGHVHGSKDSPVAVKAKKRVVQATLATLAVFAASIAMVRLGPKLVKPNGLLKRLVAATDFDYFKGSTFQTNRSHLMAMMAACTVGYLDAARDKLEFKEHLFRLPVVFTYLLFGQNAIEKAFKRVFPKVFGPIFNINVTNHLVTQTVKPLTSLPETAALLAKTMGKSANEVLIKQLIPAKLTLFFAPRVIGVALAGLGVGLVNRMLTRKRFEEQQRHEQLNSLSKLYQSMQAAPVSHKPVTPPTHTVGTDPYRQSYAPYRQPVPMYPVAPVYASAAYTGAVPVIR